MTIEQAIEHTEDILENKRLTSSEYEYFYFVLELLKKQEPRKVLEVKYTTKLFRTWLGIGFKEHKCPDCGWYLSRFNRLCPRCGQALDWS